MTVLDLFSGIGAFTIGLELAGMDTVAFCENNNECVRVLNNVWPEIPIEDNIHTLDGRKYEGVEVITGGIPCQPFSHAGLRRGQEDDRHLWPHMFRVIQQARPNWVIAENVDGIRDLALDTMLSDLEGAGYETTSFIIPACSVNAPHIRKRVWILAHYEQSRTWERSKEAGTQRRITSKTKSKIVRQKDWKELSDRFNPNVKTVAHATGKRRLGINMRNYPRDKSAYKQKRHKGWIKTLKHIRQWESESTLDGIFNELTKRSHQIRLRGGINNGKLKKERPKKVLSSMQKNSNKEKIQPSIGRQKRVSKKTILQSGLRLSTQNKERSGVGNLSKESNKIQKKGLPKLRKQKESSCAPQRSNSNKQRPEKFDDSLCDVPHQMALAELQKVSKWIDENKKFHVQDLWQACKEIGYVFETLPEIQKIWESLNDEEKDWITFRIITGDPLCVEWPDTPRIVHGVANRSHRNRMIGNSVVPQIVQEIGRCIIKVEEHFS